MAYNTKKLEQQALEAIVKHNLFFFNDISAYLPCSRATLYNLGLDKLDTIEKALEENKTKAKNSMRAKWYKSDNATLQVALMKLICNEEERQKLSQSYNKIDADIKGEVDTGSKEVAEALRAIIESDE